MIKRMIWDLDNTLAIRDLDAENAFLTQHCDSEEIDRLFSLLSSYEQSHQQFNVPSFSKYCTEVTGINYGEDFFYQWFSVHLEYPGYVVDGAEDTLAFMQNRGISNVVCTNDITDFQRERLKRLGLLSYIDEVYGGDIMLKPNVESYRAAMGDFSASECGMVGDSLLNDVCMPRSLGIYAFHFAPSSTCPYSIKKLVKVKELVL